MDIAKQLSMEMGLTLNHTNNIIALLDEGCTIPFIARYRKELTGSCDDQTLRTFDDRLKYLRSLTKRKEEVANLITEQGNMTEEIEKALADALTLTEVDDIYRPFRPKRKTRASVAIAKGLQPLADKILEQKPFDLDAECLKYIDEEKGVKDGAEALQGAKDIIAEIIGGIAGAVIMAFGYFFYEILFFETAVVAIVNVPWNLLQGGVGVILSTIVLRILSATKLLEKLQN